LEIYLRGTDKRATINLSTNDTMEDVAGKISLAMWNAGGTGIINSGILNPQQLPDLVHVNTIGVAKGTMSIVAPVPGSQIVFAGDETLLKALSLVEVRAGESPIYSISAFNIEQNKSVGETRVDSNEIDGLLPGLRIYFDNTLGLRLDPQPPTDADGGPNTLNNFAFPKAFERPVISLAGQLDTFFMHVAPREFFLQTGANQGQQISSFIADHSAQALGVEGLLVVTSELAQEAITTVDVAINRVSTQRSSLGAIQNRLESTIRNLDVAAENLTASESRIRDTDIAQETVTSTRNQILLQAGVAALAQANQLPQAVLQLLR
jgi:flagellin